MASKKPLAGHFFGNRKELTDVTLSVFSFYCWVCSKGNQFRGRMVWKVAMGQRRYSTTFEHSTKLCWTVMRSAL